MVWFSPAVHDKPCLYSVLLLHVKMSFFYLGHMTRVNFSDRLQQLLSRFNTNGIKKWWQLIYTKPLTCFLDTDEGGDSMKVAEEITDKWKRNQGMNIQWSRSMWTRGPGRQQGKWSSGTEGIQWHLKGWDLCLNRTVLKMSLHHLITQH